MKNAVVAVLFVSLFSCVLAATEPASDGREGDGEPTRVRDFSSMMPEDLEQGMRVVFVAQVPPDVLGAVSFSARTWSNWGAYTYALHRKDVIDRGTEPEGETIRTGRGKALVNFFCDHLWG